MSVVRDPAFWRRFSVAVHMEEEAQASKTNLELKHTYVVSPCTCTEYSKSLPGSGSPESSHTVPTLSSLDLEKQPRITHKELCPVCMNGNSDSARTPNLLRKPHPIHKTHRLSLHSLHNLSRRANNQSNLTLGLSGRPVSRGFKFWTSIEANPQNSESWLEEQKRKKSKRTCMCWCFWGVLIALVAVVVVVLLLLKGKGVI